MTDMQDRINELARKHLFCDAHGYYGGRSARIESFAQAIARECAEIAKHSTRYDMEQFQGDGTYMTAQHDGEYILRDDVISTIRARFGIAKE